MTPEEFIAKWRAAELKESAAAKEHFLDLCALLEIPPPAKSDPKGENFTFEKAVTKASGGKGFADVWKRNCFAWEYKGDDKSLVKAYAQLKEYADALENPPLLIVSDMREIRIHTNFQNTVAKRIDIKLGEIGSPEMLRILRWAFLDPEALRPTETAEMVTAEAAQRFAAIAQALRSRKLDPKRVAHFLNRLVFCMFVEDIGLLPDNVFSEIVETGIAERDEFPGMLGDLFRAMQSDKGRFGTTKIPWFNGGLFDDDEVLPLGQSEMVALADAIKLDWSSIEPSIFGTLFERGLDPEKRKEMASLFDGDAPPASAAETRRFFGRPAADRGVGIHYTDTGTIMKLIEPVVLRPLRAEWDALKKKLRDPKAKNRDAQYLAFRERLGGVRVLDPACGSGNFLYLALTELKNFDQIVRDEAAALGLPADVQRIGPEAVRGIEINPYAAELARVTIWIGELQWQIRRGYKVDRKPILTTLDTIECRDALLEAEGEWEASWPDAEFIVGNPPFLGTKKMIGVLGEDYVKRLRGTYSARISPFSDLVCWWFDKASRMIQAQRTGRAGFVATNSIRGGKNRKVLDAIGSKLSFCDAWADEPWTIDGAAVRVSIISFCDQKSLLPGEPFFDGLKVESIHSDMTAGASDGSKADLTFAKRLLENRSVGFVGTVKAGKFDIERIEAEYLFGRPLNPNGRPNSDVLSRWVNGIDVVRRSQDKWIIDFGVDMPKANAALYEAPFHLIEQRVFPERMKVRRDRYRQYWWLQAEPCVGMRNAVRVLKRFIATPTVAKHRVFVWLNSVVQPDHQLVAIARDDDTTFGILHSRFHELWALRLGTSLEDRPRYTPSTTFETFPFPEGLTPNIPAEKYKDDPRAIAIAAAAARLNVLREAWLNPEDLVKREPEVVPGFPDRILPRTEKAAAELKKRTLTNLYNTKPQWLVDAHAALDRAVAAAYGWPSDLTDDEILARLLALNLERAKTQAAAPAAVDADEGEGEEPVVEAKKPRRKKKSTD